MIDPDRDPHIFALCKRGNCLNTLIAFILAVNSVRRQRATLIHCETKRMHIFLIVFYFIRHMIMSDSEKFEKSSAYAHRTLHDTTRHDTTRQPPTRKSCNVRGSTTRRDTTRQKSGLVVSDLTMLDICDKARFVSCRVASCRRPPYITRFSCRGLLRRAASCNVRSALVR